ncbi:BLUF domain-containing protein [Aquidulcibacter paucihalophilus]|jgi:hypothetical protein|nr:BLUF domain-containing protein [Aquidulcibacter paucihalophilus]
MLYQRLIYRSCAVATEDLDKDLSDILDVANRHNRARGITGALAVCEDRFVQVIEGPPAQIDGLMVILTRDPRHRNIQVLGRWAASHRMFGGWDMACVPTLEMSVETRQLLRSATGGLALVTLLFSLVDSPSFSI